MSLHSFIGIDVVNQNMTLIHAMIPRCPKKLNTRCIAKLTSASNRSEVGKGSSRALLENQRDMWLLGEFIA